MRPNYISGDQYIDGELFMKSIALPAGCIDETKLAAGTKFPATKLIMRLFKSIAQNGIAVAQTVAIHKAYTAGTLIEFAAGAILAALGAATVTIDLKKNGTSVLSGPIVLTSSNAANVAVLATLATATYAAGDLLAIYQTVSASTGTLPSGVFSQLVTEEGPT